MIHPHTELRFISPEIGYGVVATEFIPRGTVTWVKDDLDQTFALDDVRQLPELFHDQLYKYSFIAPNGRLVLCWDLGRYVNHSCHANCLCAGYDFEVAVRDIAPGEELYDDYGALNLIEDFECRCGFEGCRQIIRPDDLLRYAEVWDGQVAAAFPLIPSVPQPMWPLVKEKQQVEAVIAGKSAIASCRLNYSPEKEAWVNVFR